MRQEQLSWVPRCERCVLMLASCAWHSRRRMGVRRNSLFRRFRFERPLPGVRIAGGPVYLDRLGRGADPYRRNPVRTAACR